MDLRNLTVNDIFLKDLVSLQYGHYNLSDRVGLAQLVACPPLAR